MEGAHVALSSATLERAALDAGFDLCGFARAEPIGAEHLLPWLDGGHHADMEWMQEKVAERLDVRLLLPGARTVMALATNYWHPGEGLVARCARGRDYHATLRDSLRRLRRAVRALDPSRVTVGSIDGNRVLEKVWAVRAGLGFVGKNGCLITERFGSWVVLAVLVLEREVDRYAGDVAADRCGSCKRCLGGCPTGAILDGRQVDARRCLSYLTIESEESIPAAQRGALGATVFGCDICQEVCPLNGAPVPAGPRFEPREVSLLSAAELAALEPLRHRELTQGTAVLRAGYDGLRRNAAYALGAQGKTETQPLLEQLRRDASEKVRAAAAWALARLSR